jgi:hypothetical protein
MTELRDPIWQFAGVILGLISIVVSIILYYFARARKNLSYEILAATSLLKVSETARGIGKLEVTLDDKNINGLYNYLIRFSNRGNLPIEMKDFSVSLTIAFKEPGKIIDCQIIDARNKDLKGVLNKSVEFIRPNNDGEKFGAVLKPVLINPKDWFTVQIVAEHQTLSEILIIGRISGVEEITRLFGNGLNTLNRRFLLLMIALFFALTFMPISLAIVLILQGVRSNLSRLDQIATTTEEMKQAQAFVNGLAESIAINGLISSFSESRKLKQT